MWESNSNAGKMDQTSLWHSGKLKFDVYESTKMNYNIQCRSSDFQSLDFKIHNDWIIFFSLWGVCQQMMDTRYAVASGGTYYYQNYFWVQIGLSGKLYHLGTAQLETSRSKLYTVGKPLTHKHTCMYISPNALCQINWSAKTIFSMLNPLQLSFANTSSGWICYCMELLLHG